MYEKMENISTFVQMKKLILFDLDGTLLDTLEDLAAAVNHALALHGLPQHTLDEYRRMVGHGVRNLVKDALEASMQQAPMAFREEQHTALSEPHAPLSFRDEPKTSSSVRDEQKAESGNLLSDALVDAALADFRAYYQANIDVHTLPYPGIRELLTDLQARGVQMAVVSNKFQEGTEYLVRRFFPDIGFVAILGNGPGRPLKPSPEIVQEVLRRSGVAQGDALLVGDSPTDMRTAANGGIEALAVSWGYRTTEELQAAFPEVSDFSLIDSVPALRTELLGFYVSEPRILRRR